MQQFAFLRHHLRTHPAVAVVIIAPTWLAVFGVVTLAVYETTLNVAAAGLFQRAPTWYSLESPFAVVLLLSALGARGCDRAFVRVLLATAAIGTLAATAACRRLFGPS